MTDTFSKRLQGVASDIRLLPDEEELSNSYMRMIVRNLAHVEAKANIIPTFWGTIEAVSKRNNVPDDRVKATLLRMMANGYVFQKIFQSIQANRCASLPPIGKNQSSRPLRRRLKTTGLKLNPQEPLPPNLRSGSFIYSNYRRFIAYFVFASPKLCIAAERVLPPLQAPHCFAERSASCPLFRLPKLLHSPHQYPNSVRRNPHPAF